MPSYRNTDTVPHALPGVGSAQPGDILSTIDGKYIHPLPPHFELVSDAACPFPTLWSGPIAATVISGLLQYAQIFVSNDSGAELDIMFNGDAGSDNPDNTFKLADGTTQPFESDRDIDRMSFAGTGDGNIYVYAVKGTKPKYGG